MLVSDIFQGNPFTSWQLFNMYIIETYILLLKIEPFKILKNIFNLILESKSSFEDM